MPRRRIDPLHRAPEVPGTPVDPGQGGGVGDPPGGGVGQAAGTPWSRKRGSRTGAVQGAHRVRHRPGSHGAQASALRGGLGMDARERGRGWRRIA